MPYPDAPGPRLAYDLDETQVFFVYNVSGVLEVRDTSPLLVSYMNTERNDTRSVAAFQRTVDPARYLTHVVFFFPVPTRLRGFFISATAYHYGGSRSSTRDPFVLAETSTTTTNGIDGSWNSVGPALTGMGLDPLSSFGGSTTPYVDQYDNTSSSSSEAGTRPLPTNDVYRRSRDTDTIGWASVGGSATRNVKALRFSFTAYSSSSTPSVVSTANLSMFFHAIHLYGEPDTTASEKRVSFWSAASDTVLPPQVLDWGDAPQGSSADRSFRVKNMSTYQTATNIEISAYASPSVPSAPALPVEGQMVFSTDGGVTWDSSAEIPSLSPGGVSAEVFVRRITPSNFELSNWAARVVATVGGWS